MQYSKAIVRKPGPNFAEGITESPLGKPDYELALRQHELYRQALSKCGLELIELPADMEHPDACFVEDTAIIVDSTAVITRLGHPSRRGEEAAVAKALSTFKRLVYIEEPGTVDGGDIMRVGDHYFIGVSERTNQEGAAQLIGLLAEHGKTSSLIEVAESLHLKTNVSSIGEDTILCLNGSSDQFKETERTINIPAEEHLAANCVSANGFVLMPDNCPITQEQLLENGFKVLTLDTSEFQKMDGRLTCLSILF